MVNSIKANDPIFDRFIKAHEPGSTGPKFLVVSRSKGRSSHGTRQARSSTTKLELRSVEQIQDIFNQTKLTLKKLEHILKKEADPLLREKMKKVILLVEEDFAANCPKIKTASAIRNIESVQTLFSQLKETAQQVEKPKLGGGIAERGVETRLKSHRHPKSNIKRDDLEGLYAKKQLTKVSDKRFKNWVKEHGATAFKDKTEAEVAIIKAQMKEKFVLEVYNEKMEDNVKAGFYDPGIIPAEINRILGPLDDIPVIDNHKILNKKFDEEVTKYKGHLTDHQLSYIKEDIKTTMSLYLKVYPGKDFQDAFSLGRDLIRLAVYQEIHDKGSFSGSDHGSQHIHGNIDGAEQLHSNGMEKGVDYNDKDRFMEHLIHFCHDVGYTTGLSSVSFSCCKDHPFIGAAMIDANREYFEHFLDKESAEILRNGVLFHAIAIPNLTPDKTLVGGMHPGMIRAVTSISDACALTYDRKTQEFWEQPTSLKALARLKVFLTDYPKYKDNFSKAGEDPFDDPTLDRSNPLDQMAVEVFSGVRAELFDAVSDYQMPGRTEEEVNARRKLFRQAIEQQFNTFTAQTTLGQYGGKLDGVFSMRNYSGVTGEPKYFPGFEMAPSIMYGVLKDLFGEDQAQKSFEKLVEEFGGNVKELSAEITKMGEQVASAGYRAPVQTIKTGVAHFRILPTIHPKPHAKTPHLHHQVNKEINLQMVLSDLQGVYTDRVIPQADKLIAIKRLKSFRASFSTETPLYKDFNVFIKSNILSKLILESDDYESSLQTIESLQSVASTEHFEKIIKADKEFIKICNTIRKSVKDQYGNKVSDSEINGYFKEFEKLRHVLDKPQGIQELRKLNKKFLKEMQKSHADLDLGALERRLEKTAKRLEKSPGPGPRIAKAEQMYHLIESTFKLGLETEDEYRFVFGEAAVDKQEVVASLLKTLKGS